MFKPFLVFTLILLIVTNLSAQLRFSKYAGPYAYGLKVNSPWSDGGELILNLPEHLERKPGGFGILRHNDKIPTGHWKISEDGKSAVLDIPSSTIPGVWVLGKAEVVSKERIEISVEISNDSERALEAVKPLYCHHYASLQNFPQPVRDDRKDFDNFQYTYAIINDEIVRLSGIQTKESHTLRKGGTIKGCEQKDTLLERHGGLIEEGVDAAITAVTSVDGKRKLVVAWTPGKSVFSNAYIPCLHADPFYGEISRGQTVVAKGIVILSEQPLKELISGLLSEPFGRYEDNIKTEQDEPEPQKEDSLFATVQERPLDVNAADSTIVKATITGIALHVPELFTTVEDYHNPKLKQLREQYQLDGVIEGANSEFEMMMKLRNWVHTRWPIDNNQNFSGDTFAILEAAQNGEGFYCTHSARVQHAALTAMGYVVRSIGIDCNHEKFKRSTHHGVNEVWSNDYGKWILLDAKYDVHFERNGLPLSALEIHEAARSDGGRGITKMRGPYRCVVPMQSYGYPECSVEGYWWVSYRVRQNTFTQPHWSGGSRLIIYENEAFRNTIWYRNHGGDSLSRHWAYKSEAFIPTSDRHEIEWTPGVPGLQAKQIAPGLLDVHIRSATPNFKEYVVRIDNGTQQRIPDGRLRWKLRKGKNVMQIRSINLFDISGPSIHAKIYWQSH